MKHVLPLSQLSAFVLAVSSLEVLCPTPLRPIHTRPSLIPQLGAIILHAEPLWHLACLCHITDSFCFG